MQAGHKPTLLRKNGVDSSDSPATGAGLGGGWSQKSLPKVSVPVCWEAQELSRRCGEVNRGRAS
jgi:hypothetical protein